MITPQEVESFGKEALSRLFVETLVHGNTSVEGANEIQDMVEQVLKPRTLAEGEKHNLRTLLLPQGELALTFILSMGLTLRRLGIHLVPRSDQQV